jgi:hypothetical protein
VTGGSGFGVRFPAGAGFFKSSPPYPYLPWGYHLHLVQWEVGALDGSLRWPNCAAKYSHPSGIVERT